MITKKASKNIERLFNFIEERYKIYNEKTAGSPKPWTQDKILQTYRFCNVYREWDVVTRWIADNWRTPFARDPNLWFNIVIARLINHPPTLEEIGYLAFSNKAEHWPETHFIESIDKRLRQYEQIFSGAYIVSTNGVKQAKPAYLAQHVLTPLWQGREKYAPRVLDTLAGYHSRLMAANGMGSFIAAQVIADLKYVNPLHAAPDWFGWAASGPGSRRGLNRVLGEDPHRSWNEKEWGHNLSQLHKVITACIKQKNMPELHAQDLQNCLCEFDKYERVRLGQGRPRSLYNGAA